MAKAKYAVKSFEEGRGRPYVERFASLAEAAKYVKDRWQGYDYCTHEFPDGFHTDYATFELVRFKLTDIGSRRLVTADYGSWFEFDFFDFGEVVPETKLPCFDDESEADMRYHPNS